MDRPLRRGLSDALSDCRRRVGDRLLRDRSDGGGFAPLRAAPADGAGLVAEMVPGDEVLLGQDEADGWIEVTFWRGGRFRSGAHPTGDPPTAHGWMRARDIAPDSCG